MGIDRRTLFKAGGVVAAVSALPAAVPGVAAAAPGPSGPLTTRNPLVEQRADPFITRPVDGMY